VPPSVRAEPPECLVQLDALAFGHDPLGLLDDDAAAQGLLKVPGPGLRLGHGALLQDADGGHVRQRLTGGDVIVVEAPGSSRSRFKAPMRSSRSRRGKA
jgi:hypothetical protein